MFGYQSRKTQASKGPSKKPKKREDEEISDDEDYVTDDDTQFSSVDELVELLSEKRAASRISGLVRLNNFLTSGFVYDEIESHQETLYMNVANCVKKGDAEEGVIACRCLNLLCLTLHETNEKLYNDSKNQLIAIIKDNSKNGALRAAALDCLSFMCFVANHNEDDNQSNLQLFSECFGVGDARVATAALTAWGLVASTYPPVVLTSSLMRKYLPYFAACLQSEALDVRCAAGENIALCIDSHRSLISDEDEEDEDEQARDSTGRVIQLKHKQRQISDAEKHLLDGIDLSFLSEMIEDLATDSSKQISRKERSKQKSTFRDILATIEDGESPVEELKIGKTELEFEGWAKIKQLNAVRHTLGRGLQAHLATNELLSDMFDFDEQPEQEQELDAEQRKQLQLESKSRSKEQYQQINRSRKNKAAAYLASDE